MRWWLASAEKKGQSGAGHPRLQSGGSLLATSSAKQDEVDSRGDWSERQRTEPPKAFFSARKASLLHSEILDKEFLGGVGGGADIGFHRLDSGHIALDA